MSSPNFYTNNPALLLLLGTLGTLLGIVITQLSNLFVKRIEIDAQLRYRKFDWSWEFEKKNIIEPILTFLDSELKLISFVYTQGFEDKEVNEGIKRHILDLSTISARIKALDEYELSEKFNEFTRKRLSIGNRVFDRDRKDMEGAFQELQEAERLAGEIIRLVKIRIRQQDKLIAKFK